MSLNDLNCIYIFFNKFLLLFISSIVPDVNFDDLIEEIFGIDLETQKTLRDKVFTEVCLVPGPGYLTRDPFANNLRSKLPQPQPSFKNKYESRKQIFKNI